MKIRAVNLDLTIVSTAGITYMVRIKPGSNPDGTDSEDEKHAQR